MSSSNLPSRRVSTVLICMSRPRLARAFFAASAATQVIPTLLAPFSMFHMRLFWNGSEEVDDCVSVSLSLLVATVSVSLVRLL